MHMIRPTGLEFEFTYANVIVQLFFRFAAWTLLSDFIFFYKKHDPQPHIAFRWRLRTAVMSATIMLCALRRDDGVVDREGKKRLDGRSVFSRHTLKPANKETPNKQTNKQATQPTHIT